MSKTMVSELTPNQKELVKKIEKKWKGSKFVELIRKDDVFEFAFSIPEESSMVDFLYFCNKTTREVYQNLRTQNKISFTIA